MKKWMLVPSILLASQALFATAEPVLSRGVDCEVFLKPYLGTELKEISANIVVNAGLLSQTEPVQSLCLDLKHRLLDEVFSEIARNIKEGEQIAIAAPASFDVLFTKGDRPEEIVRQHIEEVLAKIGQNADAEQIKNSLAELDDVMRATFVSRDGYLKLVSNEQELQRGEQIWCKVPEGVMSSIYRSEEEYLIAFKRSGLNCEEIKRPCFFGKVKYDMWRTFQHECGKTLGEGYISNHPFTIYYVTRAA